MTMLEHSQQNDWLQTELESMSSQGDSPAKTSVLPESKPEWGMAPEAACGQRLPDLLASYDHSTQSWKTSQRCLVETAGDGLAEFSETWPRSGMTVNGTAYRLPNLARTITEIGSGLLPAPDTQNHRDGTKLRKETIAAAERGSRRGVSLHHHVAMWPTPTASEDAAGRPGSKMQPMLGNHPSIRGSSPEEWESGTLNPQWVEWLMGYPQGHTDLKDSETP